MPKVSIIIPTYNKSLYLDFTLAGFINQSYQDFELVVIDDGSTDDTMKVVEKYHYRLNINYSYESHNGLAVARNKGIDLAKGKYIINIDSDRIPCPDFIAEHVNVLEQHPKKVSIGCKYIIFNIYHNEIKSIKNHLNKLIVKNPSLLETISENNTLFTPDSIISNFHNVIENHFLYEHYDNYKNIRDIYSDNLIDFHFGWILATGGNTAYDREQAVKVRFDERYVGWGAEDTDFAFQLYLEGFSFQFSKNAISYHQEHPRGSSEWKELKNNLNYFINKYSPFIESYLGIRTFLFEKHYDLLVANAIFKCISRLDKSSNPLIDDYKAICLDRINHFLRS